MFGSPILDVAIGMVFVYLLLSLICSAANELIELRLKNRAADLERGLRELLKDKDGSGLVQRFYSHHLIGGLFEGDYRPDLQGFLNKLLGKVNLPSYIPARDFALTLMDLIPRISAEAAASKPAAAAAVAMPSGAANATVPSPAPPAIAPQVVVNVPGAAPPAAQRVTAPPPAAPPAPPAPPTTPAPDSDPLKTLRSALQNFPNDAVRQALIPLVESAGNDASRARQNIEDWYNASMDRVSGWYKRRAHVVVLIIGFLITMGLNADSITLAKRLSTDKALRDSLVSAAEAYAKANAATPTPTATPAAAGGTVAATGGGASATPVRSTTATVPAATPITTPAAAGAASPSNRTPTPTPSPSPANSPSPQTAVTTATPKPTPSRTPDSCWKDDCKDPESPQCKLKKNQCQLEQLGLPIGWEIPGDTQTKWPGLHFWEPGFWSGWAAQLRLHFLGWLLTALAISLGAPFWFDLLNKLIVVRSTVKPKEKSPDEGSKD
jgi:hypothetical protein